MLLQLILAFFNIGLFAIGGGLATLPFIYQLSQDTGWFSSGDIANMIAVAESTPGPIGINMATFVGFLSAGIPGALLAPLALTTPSVLICLAISKILDRVRNSPLVQTIFSTLRPASAALILVAGIKMVQTTYWTDKPQTSSDWLKLDWRLLLLSTVLLLLLKKYKLHPVLLIILAAGAGMLFRL